MLNVQAIIYAIGISLLLVGYYFLHHLPFSKLKDRVNELEFTIKNKNTTISNLDALLRKCKKEQEVIGFEKEMEGLSEGINEINTTSYPKFTF